MKTGYKNSAADMKAAAKKIISCILIAVTAASVMTSCKKNKNKALDAADVPSTAGTTPVQEEIPNGDPDDGKNDSKTDAGSGTAEPQTSSADPATAPATDLQQTTVPDTKPDDTETQESVMKTMYVTSNTLNVREKADVNSKKIDSLYHGESIQVESKSVNGWYRTVDANGIAGYCSGDYLTEKEPEYNYNSPYLIKINRKQNIVIIYEKDGNGNFTSPMKAMICSVGLNNNTPLGVFDTTNKYEWRPLFNNVYGQYGTRIVGDIMFHSVPYYSMDKSDLEYEEYNKLGEPASLGCIRLAVEDVKWIYDNCPIGTTTVIYDSDGGEPLTRPAATKIDPGSEKRGWDPTDPDKNNPWKLA